MTLDQVLKIFAKELKSTDSKISAKDRRILVSLAGQLDQGNFLTQNQANLLLKIFQENKKLINVQGVDLDNLLENPVWSEKFRVIEKIRKIFLDKNHAGVFFMEFSYDKRLQNKLSSLNKSIQGNISSIGSRLYSFLFCEKNIFAIVEEFQRDGFTIDQEILNFYQEICEIKKNKKNPFDIFSLEDVKLQRIIKSDIGDIDETNLMLLHDRKFRYQYEVFPKIEEKTLVAAIAQRKSTKIFISSKGVDLKEIFKAVKELNRFPLLLIFEGHSSKTDKKSLDLLKNSVEELGIENSVGIYFRFDKTNDTDGFNSTIAESKFNKNLEDTTLVAGISNNKLPKFMVNLGWKPKSIISLTSTFKNNKSSVYFSDVDLTIFYTDRQPLGVGIDNL